jgi:hypothetical protein
LEESLCLLCIQEAVKVMLVKKARGTEFKPDQRDDLWRAVDAFARRALAGVPDHTWESECWDTVLTALRLVSEQRDLIVTGRAVEVLLGVWLASVRDARTCSAVTAIVSRWPATDPTAQSLPMRVGEVLAHFRDPDRKTPNWPPPEPGRVPGILAVFKSVEDEIISAAFESLDAVDLGSMAANEWRSLSQVFNLVTILHQAYVFTARSPLLALPSNLRSVMRIILFIADRPRPSARGSLKEMSMSMCLQQGLLFVENMLSHPAAYSTLVVLISEGLPTALTRSPPWLQESMALDGVGSFAEKIESICESILDHMWLKPVYDALHRQWKQRPRDMDRRLMQPLLRWLPARDQVVELPLQQFGHTLAEHNLKLRCASPLVSHRGRDDV